MPMRRYAWLLLLEVLLVALALGKPVAAGEPVQRIRAADVELAIPGGLEEVPAPTLPSGSKGRLIHLFSDGAVPPLQIFVQTAPPAAHVLPARSEVAAAQLARGFASVLPGAFDVETLHYEPEAGTLRTRFKAPAPPRAHAPADSPPFYYVECVAFLTKQATVLAMATAPLARAEAAQAAAVAILTESRIDAGAQLPSEPADTPSARWGGHVAAVLGGVLGAASWGLVVSWLLVWGGLSSRTAVATAGVFLVLLAGISVFRSGSLDALLALGSYVVASAALFVPLSRWLESRQGRAPKPSRTH